MIRYILVLFATASFAQTINDYHMMIIPVRFDIQKEPNQYGLNELSKRYFEQLGFKVFMGDEKLPDEFSRSCDKLYMDVTGSNSMFRTILKVVLKDCKNNIVFESSEARDKDKDNRIAFNRALRVALRSVADTGYKFNGGAATANTTINAARSSNQVTVLSESFDSSDRLYAQPIDNGFQLVDSTPKVVLRIYKTSQPDVYSATDGNSSGVLLKSTTGKWLYESFVNGEKVTRELDIKF